MHKLLYICFLLLCLSATASSQTKTAMNCGTHTTDEDISRLMLNKELAQWSPRGRQDTIFLPIQFHLVATSSGGGRIPLSQVFKGLCKLNQDFADIGMQFYFNGEFKHINNSAMYDLEYPNIPQSVRTLFSLRKVEGAINIFIGNGLSSGNSGFYTGSPDIIYMDKRYVNSDDVILAHELGHYFSLPHTFLGWESTEYNIDEPTPKEVFRGSFAYQVEYVDRSKNCEEAGDFFCGTPADYIINWSGGCDYTGGAIDPDSILLDPDETNLMSYYSFSGCEKFTFAEDQTSTIFADFQSRAELNGAEIALQEHIVEPIDLVSPNVGEEVARDDIVLSWEAVENATLYMVEVSRIPTLFALDVQIITRDLTVQMEDLAIDKIYYWRVIAFNETNFCERPSSEIRSFRSTEPSSSVGDFVISNGLCISPNPSLSGNSINLRSEQIISECRLTVFNAAGSSIGKFTKNILRGMNPITELDGIESGVYFLSMEGEKSSFKIKFMVL